MLLSEFVPIEVKPRNKRRFSGWGFDDVQVGDVIDVPVERLGSQSTFQVDVRCDYCGTIFQCHIYAYHNNKKRTILDSDCCATCKTQKIEETMLARYGVRSSLQLPEVQDKIKTTCLEKYGVEYPMLSADFQRKAEETMLQKYGVRHSMHSDNIRKKVQATLFQRYGVEHALQHPFFLEKALTKNHHITVSAPQLKMFEIIRDLGYTCELNYACGSFVYDVAVFCDGAQIDIEYDGHWWHKDRIDYDRARDHIAIANGWKVIRFRPVARCNAAPTEEQILSAIDVALHTNHQVQWIELGG